MFKGNFIIFMTALLVSISGLSFAATTLYYQRAVSLKAYIGDADIGVTDIVHLKDPFLGNVPYVAAEHQVLVNSLGAATGATVQYTPDSQGINNGEPVFSIDVNIIPGSINSAFIDMQQKKPLGEGVDVAHDLVVTLDADNNQVVVQEYNGGLTNGGQRWVFHPQNGRNIKVGCRYTIMLSPSSLEIAGGFASADFSFGHLNGVENDVLFQINLFSNGFAFDTSDTGTLFYVGTKGNQARFTNENVGFNVTQPMRKALNNQNSNS